MNFINTIKSKRLVFLSQPTYTRLLHSPLNTFTSFPKYQLEPNKNKEPRTRCSLNGTLFASVILNNYQYSGQRSFSTANDPNKGPRHARNNDGQRSQSQTHEEDLVRKPVRSNPERQDLHRSVNNVNRKSSFDGYETNRSRSSHAREQKVPSSSLSRAMGFAELGLSLAASAVGGSVKSAFTSERKSIYDSLASDEAAEKITQTLCKMRGVPLKLGQALSMQEEHLVPKPIREAMARAQKSADIMPKSQLMKIMEKELGPTWMTQFEYFDEKPIAAASIGQVHRGRTKDGVDVAVKVQYPGVADSIDSDIINLKRILGYTNILPRSFFVSDLLKNMRDELKEECDYKSEAQKQMEFRELFKGHKHFYVPAVIPHLSTRHILTSEWVDGLSVEDCIQTLSQEHRDRVGELIVHLTYMQLFDFRYMQTDPNPANYFYNPDKDILYLIDFGAVKHYSKEFVLNYMDMLHAALTRDRAKVLGSSKRLGIITGEENREMTETHVSAIFIIGEPFRHPGPFDFGNQNLTRQIYDKVPDLLQKRLKAPTQEVFALHRLLGGAFLMCMRLKSIVEVSKMFQEYYNRVRNQPIK